MSSIAMKISVSFLDDWIILENWNSNEVNFYCNAFLLS